MSEINNDEILEKDKVSDELKTRRKERYKEIYKDDKFKRFWDREDTERYVLKDAEFIDIHLITGDIFPCRLLEMGKYVYYVELKNKNGGTIKVIIPKHAVKMIVPRISNDVQIKII